MYTEEQISDNNLNQDKLLELIADNHTFRFKTDQEYYFSMWKKFKIHLSIMLMIPIFAIIAGIILTNFYLIIGAVIFFLIFGLSRLLSIKRIQELKKDVLVLSPESIIKEMEEKVKVDLQYKELSEIIKGEKEIENYLYHQRHEKKWHKSYHKDVLLLVRKDGRLVYLHDKWDVKGNTPVKELLWMIISNYHKKGNEN